MCCLQMLSIQTRLKFCYPLPQDEIMCVTKFKAFSDEKLNMVKMTTSLRDSIENNVGKGENAGYQHFLLFPHCFPQPSSLGSLKAWTEW